MNQLRAEMAQRMASALKRKSVTSCSRWALMYRVMGQPFPGPWRFKHHPWAREMHDSTAELNVAMKAAQMAFTETALNRVLFNMDVKGKSCLYLLPEQNPGASDFSTSRFDPAIRLSPHLKDLFSNVKNVGHKQAGAANLFVRGTNSKSQLKSVPVGFIVFDEVDEMDQDNIPLAMERTSGQVEKEYFMISTPTAEGFGISRYFNDTTKEFFSFQCPSCSRWTKLIYPECLVITADSLNDPKIADTHLICMDCKNILPHAGKVDWLAKGKWVATQPDSPARGFQVSQMYSMTVPPADLARSFIRSQSSPADEQEFYNSKLGIPHMVDGSSVSLEDLLEVIGRYSKKDVTHKRHGNRLRTMGVDVGKWLHIEITEWVLGGTMGKDLNALAKCKVIADLKVQEMYHLDRIMRQYQVDACVIDAQPETRAAMDFANRNIGRVKLCRYSSSVMGKDMRMSNDPYDPLISVDRTSWLDLSQGRFLSKKITLPKDVSEEYKDHIQQLFRLVQRDKLGNPVSRYKSRSDADHFAHARNYAEIALPFAASIATGNQDIHNFL